MSTVAIVVLNQTSLALAQQIRTALPATIYGLENRTSGVDVSFTNFGEMLRQLFKQNTAIIGICAAGILIRTLAPLLTDKWQEPPVLAVAEDGSAVVPLLGGLHGVNDLARQIAELLHVAPAITTTGELRFRTTLLSPPVGYRLANPADAKTFIADLLAGASVRLTGEAPWIQKSKLPISEDGTLEMIISEHQITNIQNRLVYHPKTIAISFSQAIQSAIDSDINSAQVIAQLESVLSDAEIASVCVAGVFGRDRFAADPIIHAVAEHFTVPARFLSEADLNSTASADEMALCITQGKLLSSIPSLNCAIAIAAHPLDAASIGRAQGRLAIIGTGPGRAAWMSPEVKATLQAATDWVGYKTYLDLVEPLRQQQQRHQSDNREELERATLALDLAAEGQFVAVISSGDPGIYAMAAAVFEALERSDQPAWQQIAIQVCPGISAMQAAAAQVGAPLGHDFCAISLSDLLKPWEIIEQRITAAAAADFVIAFYNPVSSQRTWQLDRAKQILLKFRAPETPVVLARSLGRPQQAVTIQSLEQLNVDHVNMQTIVLIGSSKTRIVQQNANQHWLYTPRRYDCT
jgi:cobalt-precorrin 5A hydrolase/precorrin-3B C17-methyltransferase